MENKQICSFFFYFFCVELVTELCPFFVLNLLLSYVPFDSYIVSLWDIMIMKSDEQDIAKAI